MRTSKSLIELRELNSGANPERIDGSEVQSIEEDMLETIDGHVYERTSCKTEIEYIMENKGTYGVILGKVYYRLF
jgi:hypothetical protein